MAAMQDGHRDVARRYWETLLAQLPPGSSDARMIETALSALTVSNAAPPPLGSSSAVTGTNGGSRK
jgi:cytochrome c-type biogenesis protein CcmH/NrfG